MTNEISNKIKFYNFLGILIVFIYHSTARYYSHLDSWLEVMGSSAMSFFFTISGFFMFYHITKENVLKRIKTRVKTLLVPYLFWNLIFFIYFLIKNPGVPLTFKDVFLRIVFQPYDEVMWYLSSLFVFSWFAYPFYQCLKSKKTGLILLIVTTILCYLITAPLSEATVSVMAYGWWFVKILKYLPVYLFGGYVAIHKNEWLTVTKRWCYLFLPGILISWFIWRKFANSLTVEYIFVMIITIILWLSLPEKWFKNTKTIDILCDPQFTIYAMQLLAFWLWHDWINPDYFVSQKLYEWLIVVLSYASIFSVYYLAKRFAPHVLLVATGFRSKKKA